MARQETLRPGDPAPPLIVSGGDGMFFPWLHLALPVLLVLALAPRARAGIDVHPVIVEAVVPTDSEMSGEWTLHNNGAGTAEIEIAAVAYDDYSRGRRFAGAPSWLKLGSETVLLGPGEETGMRFSILLPRGTTGESLALVFFSERPTGYGATMQGRLGTALYALAAGTARPRMSVTGTALTRDSAGTILGVALTNEGNVHLRPRGSLEVLGRTGRVVARSDLRSGAPVLPGQTERFFAAPIRPRLSPGRWRLRWTIDVGSVEGRPGPLLTGDTILNVPR